MIVFIALWTKKGNGNIHSEKKLVFAANNEFGACQHKKSDFVCWYEKKLVNLQCHDRDSIDHIVRYTKKSVKLRTLMNIIKIRGY